MRSSHQTEAPVSWWSCRSKTARERRRRRMSATGRVLVVDDDEGIRETIEAALLGDGYDVRSAEDGATALVTVPRMGSLISFCWT